MNAENFNILLANQSEHLNRILTDAGIGHLKMTEVLTYLKLVRADYLKRADDFEAMGTPAGSLLARNYRQLHKSFGEHVLA